MSDVGLLLWPKWKSAVNTGRKRNERLKAVFLVLLGLAFGLGIYFLSHHVLNYIKELYVGSGLELRELRFEINRRIVGMVILTFFAVLVFSNVITALSTFYLSDDLELVGALPVSGDALFLARFLEMVVDSSWMVVIFGTPVFIAYGAVYEAGLIYYAAIPGVILPFVLIPAGFGVIATMALVSAFPARRIRDILFLLAIFAAGFLLLLLRLMQPEKLVNPDVQMEVLDFVRSLQGPMKSWMPNFWATEVFSQMVRGEFTSSGWMYFGLLWASGLGLVVLALLFARTFYPESFSKSQEATRVIISRTSLVNRAVRALASPFQPATRQMLMKDIRVFMRDATQWSQVFLLAALVVIYIFNFRAMPLTKMPLERLHLQNIISFANIALAGFVVSALSARFVFPMVSLEGRAFWIVKSSPLSLRGFLWSKFMMSVVPLVIIGEVLIVVTNFMLKVSPVVWYVSVITIFGMTFAICGLGVGLGARFPNFHADNPAKIATSFGGVIYMIVTMSVIGAIVALEATPTYLYYVAAFRHRVLSLQDAGWIALSFSLVILLILLATFVPMRLGLKWIEEMELG